MMEQNTQMRQIAMQLIRFGIVGVLNNIISLTVYYLVVHFHPSCYLFGNALGFLVSTMNAYLCNRRFVFHAQKDKTSRGQYLLKTYCVYTLSLFVSTALLFLLVDILGVSNNIAPLCALMVTVPMNYLMNRFWIYRSDKKR